VVAPSGTFVRVARHPTETALLRFGDFSLMWFSTARRLEPRLRISEPTLDGRKIPALRQRNLCRSAASKIPNLVRERKEEGWLL
jgi:hypothetical protein